MYNYIKKAIYIKVETDSKVFNKAFKRKLNEINVPNDESWAAIMSRENEFIRIINDGAYIDFKIQKIFLDRDYVIRLGDIIDFDRQKTHTYINVKTNVTCVATTIQEASSFLGVNIRHVKKVKL
jgi:hypothetical protein